MLLNLNVKAFDWFFTLKEISVGVTINIIK